MFVYELSPIDFWDGWTRYSEMLERSRSIPGNGISDNELEKLFRRAKNAARRVGWDGDMREGPYVSGLPSNESCPFLMFAWKQDNNGTSFVTSPFELPWLTDNCSSLFIVTGREVIRLGGDGTDRELQKLLERQ